MKASHCVELLFVSQPIDARIAVVFLHGVDTNVEHGWSQPGAHKSFVTRLSEELPAAAVGTFTYPCTLRHFVEDGLSIEQLARGVAASFRDHLLEAYRTIVVVGHCLGGSMGKRAAAALVTSMGKPCNVSHRCTLHHFGSRSFRMARRLDGSAEIPEGVTGGKRGVLERTGTANAD